MRNGLLVVLGVFVGGVACEQPADRPPPLPCAGCGTPNTGISSGHAPPSDDMDGGTAGSGSSSDEPITLEGEVHILQDIATLNSARFDEPAALRVEGTNGDILGQWDGTGSFSIQGVPRADVVWTQASPVSAGLLRAVRPVNTNAPNDVSAVRTTLGIARASDFQDAFDLLAAPIVFAENAGHAILIAVADGEAASGATLLAPRDAVVLYAENGAFSDTATSTDESGIVLLANVPAGAWPGSAVPVTLGGSGSGSYAVTLVSGGVTIAEVGN